MKPRVTACVPGALAAVLVLCHTAGHAQSESVDPAYSLRGDNDSGADFSFIGSQSRLSIGITDEGDAIGEFLQVFGDRADSAWVGEGWLSDRSGGVKLNYHWLLGEPEPDDAGGVGKVFLAWDRNRDADAKLSLGGGYERDDWFVGAYLAKSITGRRHVGTRSEAVTDTLSGDVDGRPFIQTRTVTTTTRTYEHPYDYGVGLRVGRYFDAGLLRVQGGLDYERGDDDAHQVTASLGLEKYFANTPHSVALTVEGLTRDGDHETDDDDVRGWLLYRYDFGQSHRPARQYRQVAVTEAPAAGPPTAVQSELELEERAFFAFDSARLSEPARQSLQTLARQLDKARVLSRINVVGHTDSIGTEAYNLALSRRRADSVRDYLVGQGVDPDLILTQGMGESRPIAPNTNPDGSDNPEGRARNRRVAIQVLTAEPMAPPPGTTYRQEQVRVPPAWISRALRNPIPHKRTVDVYREQEQSTSVTLGERQFLNRVPEARDDTAATEQGSGVLIDVLANDTDPDGDALVIAGVTQPQGGTVTNFGNILSFTPTPDFFGTATFTYTVSDGDDGTDEAVVTVAVQRGNRAPNAVDDTAMGQVNQSLTIDVLANDSDPDNDPLTIIDATTSVMMGQVVINPDGTVTYTPKANWYGEDSFTYTISDGRGGTDSANVFLTLSGP